MPHYKKIVQSVLYQIYRNLLTLGSDNQPKSRVFILQSDPHKVSIWQNIIADQLGI